MHFSTATSSILAAVLATSASAHVVLENPPPAKFLQYGPTNPLESSGSDWPCKIPAGQKLDTSDASPRTTMVIGEPQKLSFQGKAVHGGGSCQLALTKGWDPNKDSSWSVIHSIEGGCPARNQKGNLEGPNSDVYEFKIPAGIAAGQYTFSWTWSSRIGGSPEFYQNCALIDVKSPNKKRMDMPARREFSAMSKRADYPEIFMANIGAMSGGCTTSEALKQQIPIAYPDPGPSVDRPEGDHLYKQPCDGNPRAKKGSGGGASGGSPAPIVEPSSPPASSSPAAPSSVRPQPPKPEEPSAKPTSAAPVTSSVAPAPKPSFSAPGSGGVAGGQSPSSLCTHGQFGCFADGKEAYVCTGTKWVKIFDVPESNPPRKCTPGVGNGENIVLVDA
ncbi:lytic polysaccharide monooxygenase [Apiospora kogelbergensis]|uniref:Lytic polysaccharide monooxygenase n=1 Tax=Apiospora kogelbergensis TaxID=1337665 RepID=A0AAW0R4M8_9PEZI